MNLSGTKVTDDGLKHLHSLKNLESIGLDNTEVTEDGLAHLVPLGSLERLRFYRSVTDAGAVSSGTAQVTRFNQLKLWTCRTRAFNELAKLPKLERLSRFRKRDGCGNSRISRKMKALKSLWFQGSPISDDGLKKLTQLNNLEMLLLHESAITDVGIKHLQAFPKLRSLSLDVSTNDGEPNVKSFEHLAGLKALRTLDLGGSMGWAADVSADQLVHISELTSLERLEIDEGMRLDSRTAKHLSDLSALTSLDISASTINDEGLDFLERLQALEYLTISCQITDEGLKEFVKLPKLRMLQIASPYVTDNGIADLQKQSASLQDINHFGYRLNGESIAISPNDSFLRRGNSRGNGREDRDQLDLIEMKPAPDLIVQWINTTGDDLTWKSLSGKVVVIKLFLDAK